MSRRRAERGGNGDVYAGYLCRADVQHWHGNALFAVHGYGERGDELRGGVLHDGRIRADDRLCSVQCTADDWGDHDVEGVLAVCGRESERGNDGKLHSECAGCTDVQHGYWDALCAVHGYGERVDELRGGVLHDGWNDADEDFGGVQCAAGDWGDDDVEGGIGLHGRGAERGDGGDVHGKGAECADDQQGDGDLLHADYGDDNRDDGLCGGVLHDGWNDSDDGLDEVHDGAGDKRDDDSAGDCGVHGRWCQRCGECGVHDQDAECASVQHGDGDALLAVRGDGDGVDQLRERVLHDERHNADDGLDEVHDGVDDKHDDDIAGDCGVHGG